MVDTAVQTLPSGTLSDSRVAMTMITKATKVTAFEVIRISRSCWGRRPISLARILRTTAMTSINTSSATASGSRTGMSSLSVS